MPALAALPTWLGGWPAAVGLDMVIGLPDVAAPGGRACDVAARQLLGVRRASVFTPPVRAALAAQTYHDALARHRATHPAAPGFPLQTFHLFPKLREVDAWMTPDRQQTVREVHPELSFRALHGGVPLPASKHTPAGRALRQRLLEDAGFSFLADLLGRYPLRLAADVLDATACVWSARRLAAGVAERVPATSPLPVDAHGLEMALWW